MPSYFVSYTYITAKGQAFGSSVLEIDASMTPKTYGAVNKQLQADLKASSFVVLGWQRFEEPDDLPGPAAGGGLK